MNLVGIVIASQTADRNARSALPHAPVIEQPAASLVRRIAVRLGPNHER